MNPITMLPDKSGLYYVIGNYVTALWFDKEWKIPEHHKNLKPKEWIPGALVEGTNEKKVEVKKVVENINIEEIEEEVEC